ncbi:SulP family inorganic anion transporter [Nocardia sp. NBC_01327]|uniref:SulP family inorganic anion transporter n=1 Tax=Nocardia sp. NBC_01327 TaxID=2903593 RepID=UPI002E1234F5|nr:SulP family inorganic anion transporter [Nocardia sp. NBC_01327]
MSAVLARARAKIGKPTAADVTAGMATGLFSIPEGMAYASIAGFSPVAGLYAGVMPPILGSLTASTVLMVTTLTSAIALTGQSVLSDAGLDAHSTGNVAALAIMVGLIMLLMGLLRLGVVLSFVSNAVMIGFSTGIALQIITGVFKDATDYKPGGHNKLVQVWNWLAGISHWQSTTTWVAIATVAVWAIARAIPKLESLALLVAMVVVSVAVAALSLDVELVRGIAEIPAALPGLSLPNWDAMPHLLPGALSVAMVALAQAAGVAPSMPNPDGSRSNMNGDFISQGVANIGGGLFQALPSGGSLSRTGVAASVGARTRWAGVISGIFLAVVVLTCAKLAERIPVPVIGGLILVVGGELIWGKRADIVMVWRTSKLSTAAMLATFAATTQLPLQQAIVIGAILSLLLYCVQATRGTELTALQRGADGVWSTAPVPATLTSGEVTVLNYDGSSFFAELPRLEAGLPDFTGARNAVLVLVLRAAPDIPSSAMLKLFRRYANQLHAEGGQLILTGVRPALAQALQRTGITDLLGADDIIPATTVLLGPLDQAVARGHAWIAAHEGETPTPDKP